MSVVTVLASSRTEGNTEDRSFVDGSNSRGVFSRRAA